MSFHSKASLGARHPIHNYEYADATARTGATGFVATDVGKVAKQSDNNTYWVLEATAPTWSQLNASGSVDTNAIHDNAANEISAIAEKASPVSADLIIIEDSAASGVKKKVQVGNLPGGGGGSFDLRDQIVWDHFQSGNRDTDEMGQMGWRKFGTGTGSSVDFAPEVAGHPGILQVNAGTASAARRGIALGDTSGTGGRIIVGGTSPLIYETLVRFPDAADFIVANLQHVLFGLGLKWQEDIEIEDGIYFRFTPGSDTEWSLVAASGATRTVVALGTAPSAGTWVRLGFSATATSIQGRVNGVDAGTPITTNIPTIGLGIGFKARSNGGSNSATQFDYVSLTQVTDKEG